MVSQGKFTCPKVPLRLRLAKSQANTRSQNPVSATATNGSANAEVSIGSLPETWGDHSLLRQVWVNLISNAIKYSGTRPRPRVQVYGFDAGEESVFCVKDNGVGFDMSEIGRLFRIFERLHHDEHFAGTGVGLAIVKRIVGKHLGRVWAESAPGEGAAFFFSLPREKNALIDPSLRDDVGINNGLSQLAMNLVSA